jgi:hypothetical protein
VGAAARGLRPLPRARLCAPKTATTTATTIQSATLSAVKNSAIATGARVAGSRAPGCIVESVHDDAAEQARIRVDVDPAHQDPVGDQRRPPTVRGFGMSSHIGCAGGTWEAELWTVSCLGVLTA